MKTSIMSTSIADREISRLLEENRLLTQDLKQSQADKDFVWSLWKKLQVANPDVSQAIGLVVQREREKAEVRDRKVLEILQRKDDRIEELQSNLAYNTRELGESAIKTADVNDEIYRLQRHVDTLTDRNSTLELQVRNIGSREKNLEHVHSDTIQNMETEKREMSHKVQTLITECEQARSQKADEMALRVQMESKVRVLDREVQQKLGKFEQLVTELEEARSLLRKFESQVRQQQQDQDFKNQELETVRKELAELWSTHNQLTEHSSQQADLIRQIQSLQTDTQKMMKNQEEAYSLESNSIQQMYTELTSRYDLAKKAESELRSTVLALKKELMDKEDVISELQHQYSKKASVADDPSGSFLQPEQIEPVLDLEFKCKSMQKEIDNLRRQLMEKEGHIEQLEEDAINQTIEFDVARLNRHERTHSTPARHVCHADVSPIRGKVKEAEKGQGQGHRARSMSPRRRELINKRDATSRPRLHIQKDLDDCKTILKLKVKELAELKKAHQKRAERLKITQDNYKGVKEQLKALEKEYYGAKNPQKKVKRANPKDLRHEDSPAVWNELAYFKNENRTLQVERMALEEEVDSYRVQSSQNAATVHELKLALEQEREERHYDKKKTERELDDVNTQKSEIVLLKSETQNQKVAIERLERDNNALRDDNDTLLEEKRFLKQEMTEMKQASAQHRIDQADLRMDIQRLRRQVEEERSINKLSGVTNKTSPGTSKTVVLKPASKVRRKCAKHANFNVSANSKCVGTNQLEEGWEDAESDHGDGAEVSTDTDSPDIATVTKQRLIRQALQTKLSRKPRRTPPRPVQAHACCRHSTPRVHSAITHRDTATSPMYHVDCPGHQVNHSPVVLKKSPAYNAVVRQLRPLKQRIGYLQQQVSSLRDSRAAALKSVEDLRENNNQLTTDLHHANLRLRVSKQSIQKLNSDLDRVHNEKKEMEVRLAQRLDNVNPDIPARTDHDWKVLESRLKSCSNELTRQNNVVRQLKQENEQATDQIKLLQDKVSRAERDSSQKRTLLEDQRSRVKQALETARADAESLEQVETRTKLLQDTNEKQKIQIESYKKRLGAVTRERRDYEERFLKLTADLDKKNRVLMDSQTKKQELEMSLTEMERLATQQMKSLARDSEDALDTAKIKLREVHEVLLAYQRFVKNLSQEVVRRTHASRVTMKEQEVRKQQGDQRNTAVQKVQNLAKDILNLSQSDLDDIMSADGDNAKLENELDMERRRDKKWAKKVERVQSSKDDFALALVDLFLQKLEEKDAINAKFYSLKMSNQSEASTQAS